MAEHTPMTGQPPTMYQSVPQQYGQPAPYGQPGQYGQPPITTQPAQSTTIIHTAPPPKPPSYFGLAIFTTLCCNIILGIIAIVFSLQSKNAAGKGDYDTARSQGKVSLILSCVAIFLGIALYVTIVVLYYVHVLPGRKTVYYYG